VTTVTGRPLAPAFAWRLGRVTGVTTDGLGWLGPVLVSLTVPALG
jgi:hypothetical protein